MDKLAVLLIACAIVFALVSVLFYRALPPGKRLVGFVLWFGLGAFGVFVIDPYVAKPLLYRGLAVVDQATGHHVPKIKDVWGTIPEYNPTR